MLAFRRPPPGAGTGRILRTISWCSSASGGTRTAMRAERRLRHGERAGNADRPRRQLSGGSWTKWPREPASLGHTLTLYVRLGRTRAEREGMRCAAGLSSSPLRPRAGRNCRYHCESGMTETSPVAERLLFGPGLWRRLLRGLRAPIISFDVADLPLAKGAKVRRGLLAVRWTAWRMSRGCAGGPQGTRGGSPGPARDQAVSRSVGTGFGRPDGGAALKSD